MEEFKYFRGGATLVISVDGLNWFSKSRCKKRLGKRDEEIRLWVPSGKVLQADEEPQAITRFCILGPTGKATFHPWRDTDWTSSLRTQPPSFSLVPPHCCLLQEPIRHSRFTSPHSLLTHFSQEIIEKQINLNTRDIFRLIPKHLNLVTTDFSVFTGNTDCHIEVNNVLADSVHSPCDPSNNDSVDKQSKRHIRYDFHRNNVKGFLKSCQNCKNPGALSEHNGSKKLRKRVSFDNDVIVCVYDQKTPIAELHSEPCTSQPSSLSDVLLEDSGLQWEDDFSALEKTCHFQCVRHPGDYTCSLPTQSWTPLLRPERFLLSQTCLFLTHVTESDLEL